MVTRAGPAALLAALLAAPAARADAVLAPGPTGGLGALLVAGPLQVARSKKAAFSTDFALPEGLDPSATGVRLGAPVAVRGAKLAWQTAAAPSGVIDLRAALDTKGVEATAVAAGVLRLSEPFRGFLLLGADEDRDAIVGPEQ
ncbi:MAG: hypothetical protein EOO75_06570, partial [Myxococcales bacterium]